MQTPSKLKGLMMSPSEGRPTRVTTPALLLGSAPHRLSRAEEALQELNSPTGRGPRVLSSLTWRSRNERTKVRGGRCGWRRTEGGIVGQASATSRRQVRAFGASSPTQGLVELWNMTRYNDGRTLAAEFTHCFI